MKKHLIIFFVLMTVLSTVLSVSAAPRSRRYDQLGNKHWCNIDDDGCWVTGEEGERIYIMFWSEASRSKYMGEGSNAPLGIEVPGSVEMQLEAPKAAPALPSATTDGTTDTPVPSTDTPVPSTDTPVPPTDTPVPPTDTPVPPTDTPVPPTDTPVPPTDTPVPPTDTPVPPTDTPVPPTDTPVPPTDTPVPPTPTRDYDAEKSACLNQIAICPSKDITYIKRHEWDEVKKNAFVPHCSRGRQAFLNLTFLRLRFDFC